MVDMCSCVIMMSDYCQEMIQFWFIVETNHGMSWVCETCLLSCDVQVLSVETVDDNGEGQVSLYRWTESGEGRTWRFGPRDRGPEDGPWTMDG